MDSNFDPQELLGMISELRGKRGIEFKEKVISIIEDLKLSIVGIRFQFIYLLYFNIYTI